MKRTASRPRAIVMFETLFFVHLGIWLLLTLLSWGNRAAWMGLAGHIDMLTGMLVAIGLELLAWFFIARIGSNIARWIYGVLLALDLIGTVLLGMRGWWPGGLFGGLLGIAVAVRFAAVWLLFVPNADPWFKRGRRVFR